MEENNIYFVVKPLFSIEINHRFISSWPWSDRCVWNVVPFTVGRAVVIA